ncbi:MAG: threonine synthase [Actinomycetota bacterium]|nr:threonine synthase [Actinomycetota bacterium]
MKYVRALVCKECGREYPIEPEHVCSMCFGPLEVAYDYDAIAAEISWESIVAGPPSIWRYGALLPDPTEYRIDIGAGFTRLRPAPRLAEAIGIDKLWLKLDGGNPTHSFKDRVVSVALSVARAFGRDVAACASTGNLANAVAAHAAASGMKSVVFIPSDLESGKVAGTVIYGGEVVAVDGSYDQVNRLCAELAGERPSWAFVNVGFRPYYSEGSKTLAFEIVEQLGGRAPDAVVVPIASGSLLTKVAKGLRELHRVGLLQDAPATVIHGAQAEGCSPVARAFEAGSEVVKPVKPATIAKSLAIGDPADGYYAIKEAKATGGRIAWVPESDVVEGMKLLARTEGVFTETAGGVTIATLAKLVKEGSIARGEETVALITGIGLKTLEALGSVEPTHRIEPRVEEVDRVLGTEGAEVQNR